MVTFGLAGVLIGIFLAVMFLRPARGSGAVDNSSPVVPVERASTLATTILETLEGNQVGFLRSDGNGRPSRVSPGLGRLLAGVGPDAPPPSVFGGLEDWATAIHPDDREEVSSLLMADGPNPNEPRQIRVRSTTLSGEDRLRWFEIRRLAVRGGEIELILVDQTDRVESDLRRRDQLRNQRILNNTADCLVAFPDLLEAVSEFLPRLGRELDLCHATWFERDAAIKGESFQSHANWVGSDGVDQGNFLEELDFGTLDFNALFDGGRPQVGFANHPSAVLVPVLVNGGPGPLLVIESHRYGLWNEDTIETLARIGELLGRAREREIEEAERESWAATRGWLERSEAISQLTSGLTHDFNGVLFAVLGRFELLRSRIEDPEAIEQIDFIAQTIQEAKRLGDRLRSSVNGGRDPIRVNVRPELEEIFETARKLLPKRIRFEQTMRLPEVTRSVELLARADTLQQVLLNLLVNARDAVDRHGRILLGSRLLPSGELEIRVDDDGPGIPPEERSRMLEPYETGDASEGVGLGLAVSRRLAEDAGGRLVLEQSPLGGLAVRVVLPVDIEPSPEAGASKASEGEVEAEGCGARQVIVVEDNPVIRDVLVRVLEGMGVGVVARSHAVGIEETMTEEAPIDLLILDIDLPERTGVECLNELRNRGDMTPCLLITGGLSEPPRLEASSLLRKPFRIEELRLQIEALLAR